MDKNIRAQSLHLGLNSGFAISCLGQVLHPLHLIFIIWKTGLLVVVNDTGLFLLLNIKYQKT